MPRLKRLVRLFRRAGLAAAICLNIDAWQKSHVALIVPIGWALAAPSLTDRRGS